jgi:hypothetical protein
MPEYFSRNYDIRGRLPTEILAHEVFPRLFDNLDSRQSAFSLLLTNRELARMITGNVTMYIRALVRGYGTVTQLLSRAARGHATWVFRKLIEQTTDLNYANGFLLRTAVINSFTEGVVLLLERGARPDIWLYKEGTSLLGYAAENNYYDVVRVMLDHGAKLYFDDGVAMLMPVALKGYVEVASLLLRRGVVDIQMEGHDCLLSAESNGHTEMVNLLRAYGARIYDENELQLSL